MPQSPDNELVEPFNDANIGNADVLIRRIDPEQHVVPDANRGCLRLSSKAFKPSSTGGLSIDIEQLIDAAGLDPRVFVTTPKFQGSVQFPAGVPRAAGLWVGHEPVTGNPYHGEVWNPTRKPKFNSTQIEAIGNAANWFVPLEGVELYRT